MAKFIYIICTGLSILLFYLCNKFSEPLKIHDEIISGSSNGNPGLFPWLFLFPFFLGFLFGTSFYLLKWLRKLRTSSIYTLLCSSFVLSFIISIFTYVKAIELREKIVEVHPSFSNIKQLSILNTWSNYIFFNTLTFILVVLLILFVCSLFAVIKKDKLFYSRG